MQIEAVRGIMADGKFIQRGLPVEVTYKTRNELKKLTGETATVIGVLIDEAWKCYGSDLESNMAIQLDTSKPLHNSFLDIPYEDIVSICGIQVDENGNKVTMKFI